MDRELLKGELHPTFKNRGCNYAGASKPYQTKRKGGRAISEPKGWCHSGRFSTAAEDHSSQRSAAPKDGKNGALVLGTAAWMRITEVDPRKALPEAMENLFGETKGQIGLEEPDPGGKIGATEPKLKAVRRTRTNELDHSSILPSPHPYREQRHRKTDACHDLDSSNKLHTAIARNSARI